ncbi:MAG: hypothetical protein ABFE13_17035 [Phycisphaerales bacterium]
MNGSQFSGKSGRAEGWFSALILLILTTPALGSATNSAARATVPPSSYQSGLINSRNPIDQSGNLAITGNVGGGKHFRGGVPYRSTTSFGAPLGSTSLDSFLRYSAVPEGQAGYPQNYSPFYSPTRTVTTTSPGYQGIFTAASPRIAGGMPLSRVDQPSDTMSAAEIPQLQTSIGERSPGVGSVVGQSPRLPYWTAPIGSDEMRDAIEETGNPSAMRSSVGVDDPLMTSEEYQRRLQLLLQDLDRARTNAAQIEQKLDADGTKTRQQPTGESPGQLPPADAMQDRIRLPDGEPRDAARGVGPESTGLRLYDPSAQSESSLFMPPSRAAEIRPSVMAPRREAPPGPPSLAATLQRISEYTNRLQTASRDRSSAQAVVEPDQNPAEAASPQQVPAEEPPQTYENSDLLTRQQFDQCMATASLNMRKHRFDRAVESFTLASVYIAHDSRAHLGRSHALLAVGDFVTSALSLARAIELDAQLALKRVNLVEIVGGPDSFVERVAHLEELAEKGDSSLQFLLAYIYYQMDRPNEAKTAIEMAGRGGVSSVAVDRLSVAIGQ